MLLESLYFFKYRSTGSVRRLAEFMPLTSSMFCLFFLKEQYVLLIYIARFSI